MLFVKFAGAYRKKIQAAEKPKSNFVFFSTLIVFYTPAAVKYISAITKYVPARGRYMTALIKYITANASSNP